MVKNAGADQGAKSMPPKCSSWLIETGEAMTNSAQEKLVIQARSTLPNREAWEQEKGQPMRVVRGSLAGTGEVGIRSGSVRLSCPASDGKAHYSTATSHHGWTD